MTKKTDKFPKKIERLSPALLEKLIEIAVHEDLNNSGDVTTLSVFKDIKEADKKAKIIAREDGVVCGVDVVKKVYEMTSSKTAINVTPLKADGDIVKKGETIITLEGRASAITTGERIALNFLGLLSGVSTKVYNLTQLIKDTPTRLLDTRKTIPGLRELQKYAVLMGGGFNHRIGLYDMVLIKENHINAIGSLTKAVSNARETYPGIVVEVETETLDDVREAMQTTADIIMLDNMDNATVTEALGIINGEKWSEVSGDVNEKRLVELSKLGVDFVSMGALTHTVRPLNLSLLIEE